MELFFFYINFQVFLLKEMGYEGVLPVFFFGNFWDFLVFVLATKYKKQTLYFWFHIKKNNTWI